MEAPHPTIQTVWFTRAVAARCREPGLDDLAVCNAVVNGDRAGTRSRGPRGGALAWCRLPLAAGRSLAVLAERVPGGWVARRVRLSEKYGPGRDF